LAVILVYWPKIRATLVGLPRERSAQRLALNVLIAFLPAVVLGFWRARRSRSICSRRWSWRAPSSWAASSSSGPSAAPACDARRERR